MKGKKVRIMSEEKMKEKKTWKKRKRTKVKNMSEKEMKVKRMKKKVYEIIFLLRAWKSSHEQLAIEMKL